MALSSISTLQILTAERTDIQVFTEIYLTSFTDALSHACFPRNDPAVRHFWTEGNKAEFDEASAHYLKVVDLTTNNIAAYGKWNVPVLVNGEMHGGGDDPGDMPKWPVGGESAALANEFFGELARRRKIIMNDRPHCYLEIITTRPEFQRRGAAATIMRWGCDYADRNELECYLEAGPDLVPFYQRFGFEVVGVYSPSRMLTHVESFMVRRATVKLSEK